MIHVVYDRTAHCLTMDGHAGAGVPGQDTVCAAASILAYTLAASVVNMQKLGRLTDFAADLREGSAEIRCVPDFAAGCVATLIFDTVCAGFELLAESSPDKVKYDLVM